MTPIERPTHRRSLTAPAAPQPRHWEPQFTPHSYTEGVSLTGTEHKDTAREYLAECIYDADRRFLEGLLLEPRMTPQWYSTSAFMVLDSTRKRYKDIVLFLPKMKARVFSETVLVFPKVMKRVFTTTVTYKREWRVSKWYVSGMELSPRMGSGGRRAFVVGLSGV